MKPLLLRTLYCSIGAFCLLMLSFYAPFPQRLAVEHSTFLLYRDGTPAHVFLAPDDRWRIQTDLEQIDPAYIETLLGIERFVKL